MTEREILGILKLLVVLLTPVIAWFWYLQRKARALTGALPIKAGWLLFDLDKSGTIDCAGMPCHYAYCGWAYRRHSFLKLSVDCTTFGHFDIGKRFLFSPGSLGSGNWLIKKMRVMSGISTGDPHFDEKFSVASATPQFATTFLRNPDNRKIIDDICQSGFNSVHFDGKTLSALWSPFMTFYQKMPNPSFVEETVRLMSPLTRQITAVSKELGTESKSVEGLREWTQSVRLQLVFLVLIVITVLYFLLKYFFK